MLHRNDLTQYKNVAGHNVYINQATFGLEKIWQNFRYLTIHQTKSMSRS